MSRRFMQGFIVGMALTISAAGIWAHYTGGAWALLIPVILILVISEAE